MQLEALQQRIVNSITTHPLIQAIPRKELELAQYRTFMKDVYSYAKHSPQIIALTAVRLFEKSPDLARYCVGHAAEEVGHDKWAASDLRDLGMTDQDIKDVRPSSPCLRLIGLEYFYAQHLNPMGMIGWMFVLESLGGNVGNSLAASIDEALELKGKGTYFLGGHGEADIEHSKDLFEVIAATVKEPLDVEAFERMALEGEQLYCSMMDHAFATAA